MSYDIKHLHIREDSQEGRAVQAIMARDHVSIEQAVLAALREVPLESGVAPAEILGAFSSDSDAATMNEAMSHVRAIRFRALFN